MAPAEKFRPILAAKLSDVNNPERVIEQLARLQYPLFALPKIDGIRCLHAPEGPVTRTWKLVPNRHVQECFAAASEITSFLDGELIAGDDPTAHGICHQTQSAVMTHDGTPHFTYWVFDEFRMSHVGYDLRYHAMEDAVRRYQQWSDRPFQIFPVPFRLVSSVDEVLLYEQECVEQGYEGIVLRHPQGPYKFNRSTLREQYLIKLKRTADEEATIVGFGQLERNLNPLTRNVYGLAQRTSHKDGKVADEFLGELIVHHPRWGEFRVGSGFDLATRHEIWQNQTSYLGKQITFHYLPHGTIDKPRHPIFKGLRHD